jgi:hypothetical protein
MADDLVDKAVDEVWSQPSAPPVPGLDRLTDTSVAGVEAIDAHVLVWFRRPGKKWLPDVALHTEMGVNGTWRVLPEGDWRPGTDPMDQLALLAAGRRAVCAGAVLCEVLSVGQVAAHPALGCAVHLSQRG